VEGKDYFFISEEEFKQRMEEGAFLEYAQVHDAWYGTQKSYVYDAVRSGKDILMDLDVQGAALIRKHVLAHEDDDALKRAYADIFIAPPSLETLRHRLQERGKDNEDVIERRVQMAETEMERWNDFQYLIVNDDLAVSYDALRSIFISEHHRIRGE